MENYDPTANNRKLVVEHHKPPKVKIEIRVDYDISSSSSIPHEPTTQAETQTSAWYGLNGHMTRSRVKLESSNNSTLPDRKPWLYNIDDVKPLYEKTPKIRIVAWTDSDAPPPPLIQQPTTTQATNQKKAARNQEQSEERAHEVLFRLEDNSTSEVVTPPKRTYKKKAARNQEQSEERSHEVLCTLQDNSTSEVVTPPKRTYKKKAARNQEQSEEHSEERAHEVLFRLEDNSTNEVVTPPKRTYKKKAERNQQQFERRATRSRVKFNRDGSLHRIFENIICVSERNALSDLETAAVDSGSGNDVVKTSDLKIARRLCKSEEDLVVTVQRPNDLRPNEQLVSIAQVELANKSFLKSERLNFRMIRKNIYKGCRIKSEGMDGMRCDCFLTAEDEASGKWGCGKGCLNRVIMIECGSECRSKERCTNKRFQRQLCSPCRVFRTEKKGFGIVAEVQINPGDFIMEYVGEVINNEEFLRRKDLYSENNNLSYFMSLHSNVTIDSTKKGNVARFINHSCDPNAETQKWTVNGLLRIGFFSRKTIMPGEEITFDYDFQNFGMNAERCFCEASNCRGWIGNKPVLSTASGNDDANRKRKTAKRGVVKTEKSKLSHSEKKCDMRDQEDPDVEVKITQLKTFGIKNQTDIQKLMSLMARAKHMQTRLNLLEMLQYGEILCRRLFLDYHGLHLLNEWLNEYRNNNEFRLPMIEALESLPIPSRTMLIDSEIYQTVESWNDNKIISVSSDEIQGNTSSEQVGAAEPPHNEFLQRRIIKLITNWDKLPDIYRIPKSLKINRAANESEASRIEMKIENFVRPSVETDHNISSDTTDGTDTVSTVDVTTTNIIKTSNQDTDELPLSPLNMEPSTSKAAMVKLESRKRKSKAVHNEGASKAKRQVTIEE